MDHYQQTADTYNAIARIYEEKFMEMDIYDASYAYFCEALAANAQVLEIAAGPGNIARYLLKKRPDIRLLGTDTAPAMVELAARNNPTAEFRVLDFRHIDQLEQHFDGIICGFGLPYLEKKDCLKFIADCASLLTSGGTLYLSFVPGPYESSQVQKSSNGKFSVYFHFYETEFVRAQLKNAGLVIQQQLNVEYIRSAEKTEIHTVLLASKP